MMGYGGYYGTKGRREKVGSGGLGLRGRGAGSSRYAVVRACSCINYINLTHTDYQSVYISHLIP